MFKSNIEGLAAALASLEGRIRRLENMPRAVTAGANVRVSQTAGAFVVSADVPEPPRRPVVIWIDRDSTEYADPWEDVSLVEDKTQGLADALLSWFDNEAVPDPIHGDIVAGLDKNDKLVLLKVTVPRDADNARREEQARVPAVVRESS